MAEITTLENNIDNVFNLLLVEFKNHNITVYGTWEEPLFKAKDIGDMLGISDIRTTLRNLDSSYRHTMPVIDSLGRFQETTFK